LSPNKRTQKRYKKTLRKSRIIMPLFFYADCRKRQMQSPTRAAVTLD
jgi:hypothetical protein